MALETIRMTPESVPPVTIHALVELAAETRPRSTARCSDGVSWKSIAPPVTEMITSGAARFHRCSIKLVRWIMEHAEPSAMNGAGALDGKHRWPLMAGSPSCVRKRNSPKPW